MAGSIISQGAGFCILCFPASSCRMDLSPDFFRYRIMGLAFHIDPPGTALRAILWIVPAQLIRYPSVPARPALKYLLQRRPVNTIHFIPVWLEASFSLRCSAISAEFIIRLHNRMTISASSFIIGGQFSSHCQASVIFFATQYPGSLLS